MKAHVGVDATSGLAHRVIGTVGNIADVTQAHVSLHDDGSAALGDAGYQDEEKRLDHIGKSVTWHVAMRRSKRKALPYNQLGRLTENLEHLKAIVRTQVEHPFHAIKNMFLYRKTRCRRLAKNNAQLFPLFAFANLVLAGRRLRSSNPVVRPDYSKTRNIAPIEAKNGLERLASQAFGASKLVTKVN